MHDNVCTQAVAGSPEEGFSDLQACFDGHFPTGECRVANAGVRLTRNAGNRLGPEADLAKSTNLLWKRRMSLGDLSLTSFLTENLAPATKAKAAPQRNAK